MLNILWEYFIWYIISEHNASRRIKIKKKRICIYKRPLTRETFITLGTYSIDPFTVLTTIFDWDKQKSLTTAGMKALKSVTLPRLKAKTKPHSGRII